jgi:hypothetical protein
MRQVLIVAALVLSAALPAGAQILNLPTEAANPPTNDVWIWVEQPVGPVARAPRVFRFWAFRCGGTITAVRPSVAGLQYSNPFLALTAGNALVSNLPRPDIVAAMAARCGSIPTNIGYELTWNLQPIPSGSYSIDLEVTDDRGKKTMLRQVRGAFTLQ